MAPNYAIATGVEECEVAYAMIDDAAREARKVTLKPQLAGSEGAEAEPQGAQAAGNLDLCSSMSIQFKAICKGYSEHLQACPSFQHDLCHEDVGGSERVRSPCPNYLKAYYCLRINPIYCLDWAGQRGNGFGRFEL